MSLLRNALFVSLAVGCAHPGAAPISEEAQTPIGETGFALAPGGWLLAEGFSMQLPLGMHLLRQDPITFKVPEMERYIFVRLVAESVASQIDEEGCARLARESLGSQNIEVHNHHVTFKEGQSMCWFQGAGAAGHFQVVAAFAEGRMAVVTCGEAEPSPDFCPSILSTVTVEPRRTLIVQK